MTRLGFSIGIVLVAGAACTADAWAAEIMPMKAPPATAASAPAAERFGVSVSSGVRWLQRWNESGSAAPKPRGGSVSPLEAHEERILALIAERPDLTLKETLVELLKRRIRTSRSALSRFFGRHGVTFKKKPASRRTAAIGRRPGTATLDPRAGHA
jgi:transposase